MVLIKTRLSNHNISPHRTQRLAGLAWTNRGGCYCHGSHSATTASFGPNNVANVSKALTRRR